MVVQCFYLTLQQFLFCNKFNYLLFLGNTIFHFLISIKSRTIIRIFWNFSMIFSFANVPFPFITHWLSLLLLRHTSFHNNGRMKLGLNTESDIANPIFWYVAKTLFLLYKKTFAFFAIDSTKSKKSPILLFSIKKD